MKRKSCPVASRFTKAAGTYDSQPGIQSEVALNLAKRLEDRPEIDATSILEAGCGTGFLTRELCRIFPESRIVAVDIADTMLGQVRRHLSKQSNISLMQADIRKLATAERFTLIVSSSALHWMLPLEETFKLLRLRLKRDGHIMFAMMVKGTLGELHALRAKIAPQKRLRRSLPTASEVIGAMRESGFTPLQTEVEERSVRYASPAALLKAIHHQGVTGGFTASDGLLMRGEMRALMEEYEQRHATADGGVDATYKVLYVEGVKT